jgi:hypothetical protein
MFNDWHWLPHRTSEQEQRFEDWIGGVRGARLAIVEIGAGSAVPTVRMTSERIATRTDATLIRINPREPQVPHGHIGLAANAVEVLQEIDGRLD